MTEEDRRRFHAMIDELQKRRCDRVMGMIVESIQNRSAGKVSHAMAHQIAEGLILDIDWNDILVIARVTLNRR